MHATALMRDTGISDAAESIDAIDPARLADDALAALLDEATLAPKPGLVDPRGRGAHDDLDWPLMCRSARALRPTFDALARAARHAPATVALRERLGVIGRQGEATMLAATGGINTHRGAIWALGLLVAAAAQQPLAAAPRIITAHAGALARLPDRQAPAATGHPGERARRRYGVGGALGQARAGFPHVIDVALPALWQARAHGASETTARLDALLALMACLDDTCVLARGGAAALAAMQQGARDVLRHGGTATLAGRRRLKALDARLLTLRVSPGGAADLLAAALFLDRHAHRARLSTQG